MDFRSNLWFFYHFYYVVFFFLLHKTVGYYNDFIYTIELANRLYNFEFNSQNTFGKNSKKKKLEQTNSPQKGN